MKTCDKCYGIGTIPCENCNGSGKIKNIPHYRFEKATIYDERLLCHKCNGSGKKRCIDCDGSGESDDE